MSDIKKGFDEGVKAARYFGTEFQANPGSDMDEYLSDCASYFGFDSFMEMPAKEKAACLAAFNEGIKAERGA